MTDRIRIGELARRAGCSADAVHYHERACSLSAAPRSEGNFASTATMLSNLASLSATFDPST